MDLNTDGGCELKRHRWTQSGGGVNNQTQAGSGTPGSEEHRNEWESWPPK